MIFAYLLVTCNSDFGGLMDYQEAFKNLGLSSNECIYVASSSISLLWNPSFVSDINSSLLNYFKDGTIIMPSFCSDFITKGVFDVEKSKSICGQVAEFFRLLPFVRRTTMSPLHTVCYKGYYERDIMDIRSNSSFGQSSVFEFLKNINARVLLIDCCFFDGVPFINALEEEYQVPYRYWKKISGAIKYGNRQEIIDIQWYAKCIDCVPDGCIAFPNELRRNCLTRLGSEFFNKYNILPIKYNKTKFVSFKLSDFYDFFGSLLLDNNKVFIMGDGISNSITDVTNEYPIM